MDSAGIKEAIVVIVIDKINIIKITIEKGNLNILYLQI